MKPVSTLVRRINIENALFFQCDIQTRFASVIHKFPAVVHNTARLTQIANALEIPIIATIHNSKVFGQTEDAIKAHHTDTQVEFEKLKFSMLTDEVQEAMSGYPDRRQAVIYGIEGHVCVQQTCLELLENGYDVHIIADSVSSSRPFEREFALRKMEQSGAQLTTVESLIFELLRYGDHPAFKSMLKIVKDLPAEAIDAKL